MDAVALPDPPEHVRGPLVPDSSVAIWQILCYWSPRHAATTLACHARPLPGADCVQLSTGKARLPGPGAFAPAHPGCDSALLLWLWFRCAGGYSARKLCSHALVQPEPTAECRATASLAWLVSCWPQNWEPASCHNRDWYQVPEAADNRG